MTMGNAGARGRERSVREMHADGLSDLRCAQSLGVAVRTAERIRQRLGLPRIEDRSSPAPKRRVPLRSRITPLTVDEQKARMAVRCVAGRSRDAGECRDMLGMLGLDARAGR